MLANYKLICMGDGEQQLHHTKSKYLATAGSSQPTSFNLQRISILIPLMVPTDILCAEIEPRQVMKIPFSYSVNSSVCMLHYKALLGIMLYVSVSNI